MKFYGGLINRMQEGAAVTTVPSVGDGATMFLYSDRHAYTVRTVTVSPSGKTITIRASRDKARRTDSNGFSESQDYEFTTEPPLDVPFSEDIGEVFKSVNGKPFRNVYAELNDKAPDGCSLRMGSTILRVGHRDEYYDFTK
jgi:hypothetical protein